MLADTEQRAIIAANYATRYVTYGPIEDATDGIDRPEKFRKPILTIAEAREIGSIYPDFTTSYPFMSHVWKVTRPGSIFDWVDPKAKYHEIHRVALDGVECYCVRSKVRTGRQIHFYMETQSAVAIPLEDDRMMALPSSQSPSECHQTCADALAVESNRVEVEIRQLGGSFGGKTEQSRFIIAPATVAARALQRPVRIAMSREADTAMMGQRGGIEGDSWIAIDKDGKESTLGSDRPCRRQDEKRIQAWRGDPVRAGTELFLHGGGS